MSNTTFIAPLQVNVLATADELSAEVRDRRPDSVALFAQLTEPQREQLVHDAWLIGLRALHNAHSAAQEARLSDVGQSLLADIDRQLKAHVQSQQTAMVTAMTRFFDPQDGQLPQRLSAFLGDQGVLVRQLEKFLAPQSGVLSQVLARQVGESSPLFRKLSATDSEGLVKVLEVQLAKVMQSGHSELVRALDPLAEDGAVARFLRSLREELQNADEDRAEQLQAALSALDANDEDSLLSRLIRETERARRDVLTAVNPDAPGSPIAVLKVSLTKLLTDQTTMQREFAKEQAARQTQLEKDVREALARIETRKSEALRNTQGGVEFEDAAIAFVRAATQGAPCVLDVTGRTPGAGRCKKGDAVLRFTAESAFVGTAVVFEAKRETGFTAQQALDELDEARKNRHAAVGVFIMARTHASPNFPRFARCGNNVLVVWDQEDPSTDPYLHAAVLVGMALVARTKTTGDAGDIKALQDVEARIEQELSRLEKMEKHSDSIRKSVDGMSEEIRKGRAALGRLLTKAQSTLRALNIELSEEIVERASPIALPVGSLEKAVLSLPRGDEALTPEQRAAARVK